MEIILVLEACVREIKNRDAEMRKNGLTTITKVQIIQVKKIAATKFCVFRRFSQSKLQVNKVTKVCFLTIEKGRNSGVRVTRES